MDLGRFFTGNVPKNDGVDAVCEIGVDLTGYGAACGTTPMR